MADQTQDQAPARKPIETHRDGRLSAAIWANDGGEHGPIYNATLSYSYKNKDGEWRDTSSIPGNELLKAAHLSEKAYTSIQLLRDQDRAKYVQQQQSLSLNNDGRERPRER